MTLKPDLISPFSNGTQYMDWEASNCARCKKAATEEQFRSGSIPCEIQKQLAYAAVDDGTIPNDIAERMGYFESRNRGFSYVWQCGEVEWTEAWKAEWRKKHDPT